MSRLVLAVLVAASVGCGSGSSEEPPNCGAASTDAGCQESSGGMGGTSLASSTGVGSSSTGEGSSSSGGGGEDDVRDRLYRGRGRYVRTDNAVVVHDVEQFFSGMLEAPIDVDEKGNVGVGGGVITGTNPDGTRAPGTHCENWTLDSPLDVSAYAGSVAATDGYWTMNMTINPRPCSGLASRLYCIEGK